MAKVSRAVLSSHQREGRDEDRTGKANALLPALQKLFVALSVLKGKHGGDDRSDQAVAVILTLRIISQVLQKLLDVT